jgi:hypothetical protein
MNNQYLQHEVIDKEATKKKEENKTKQVVDFFNVANRTTQRLINKCVRTIFKSTWCAIAKKVVGDKFNHNFAL